MLRLQWEWLNGRTGHEAGRQLLGRMVREITGSDLPEIAVTPRGKPFFPGNPLYFSISHTPKRVFCAVSRRPVGIDAEEPDRTVNPKLAGKILSPAEYRRWLACPDRNAALLRFWVLKEAAAKLTGEGLRGYPNHTDFSPDDPRIQIVAGCPVAVFQQEDSHAL